MSPTVTQWLKKKAISSKLMMPLSKLLPIKLIPKYLPKSLHDSLKNWSKKIVVRVEEPLAIIETSETSRSRRARRKPNWNCWGQSRLLGKQAKEILAPPTPAVPTQRRHLFFSISQKHCQKEGLTEAELQPSPVLAKMGAWPKKIYCNFYNHVVRNPTLHQLKSQQL